MRHEKELMTIKHLKLVDKLLLINIVDDCELNAVSNHTDDHWSWLLGLGKATVSRSITSLVGEGLINKVSVLGYGGYDRTLTMNADAIARYINKYKLKEPKPKPTEKSQGDALDQIDLVDLLPEEPQKVPEEEKELEPEQQQELTEETEPEAAQEEPEPETDLFESEFEVVMDESSAQDLEEIDLCIDEVYEDEDDMSDEEFEILQRWQSNGL